MKVMQILSITVVAVAVAVLPAVTGFSNSASRKAFVGRQQQKQQRQQLASSTLSSSSTSLMDTEGDAIDFASKQSIEALLSSSFGGKKITIDEAKSTNGMPWTHSIDEELGDDALLYMPFWNWQMDFMEKSLTNLRAQPCSSEDVDFTFNQNKDKKSKDSQRLLCFRWIQENSYDILRCWWQDSSL